MHWKETETSKYHILHYKQKKNAVNKKGNYVLATHKTTENYGNLKESLANLTEEMSKLNKVKVGGKSYNIKQFLGGDWKFSTCVCGLGDH